MANGDGHGAATQRDNSASDSEQCPHCGLKCSTLLDVGQSEAGIELACPTCSREVMAR